LSIASRQNPLKSNSIVVDVQFSKSFNRTSCSTNICIKINDGKELRIPIIVDIPDHVLVGGDRGNMGLLTRNKIASDPIPVYCLDSIRDIRQTSTSLISHVDIKRVSSNSFMILLSIRPTNLGPIDERLYFDCTLENGRHIPFIVPLNANVIR